MTPVEIIILAIMFLSMAKNGAVDMAYAVRGQTSPRLQARLARATGSTTRYGARNYLSDLASDFWRGARDRREARRAGTAPPPRRRGRLGSAVAGLRNRATNWWDRATTTVDNRRQAELIEGQERLYHSRWQRLRDRLFGRDARTWPDQRQPDQRQYEDESDRRGSDYPPLGEDYDWPRDTNRGGEAADPAGEAADPQATVPPQRSAEPPAGTSRQDEPDTATPPQPAPTGGQSTSDDGRQYVTEATQMPSGETTGVISGAAMAKQIRLAIISLRETTGQAFARLCQAIDQQEAAAAELGMDQGTLAALAQAREAMVAAQSAVNSACEEADAAMVQVESAWAKHHPGVELNQATGGLAQRQAYEN